MVTEIIIKGNVQGVSYRYYTANCADRLHLKGTVQNQKDGSVKVIAEGPTKQIKTFIDWCRIGSPASLVSEITIVYLEKCPEIFVDFTIKR